MRYAVTTILAIGIAPLMFIGWVLADRLLDDRTLATGRARKILDRRLGVLVASWTAYMAVVFASAASARGVLWFGAVTLALLTIVVVDARRDARQPTT